MENANFLLIGFKNLNRKKDNKPMTMVTCIADCTSQDNDYGAYGKKALDFFLPDDLVGSITMDAVGKNFIPEYELNGFGKPALRGYKLK